MPTSDIQQLQAVRSAQITKYNDVKNTVSSYKGQIARGKAFLTELVEKRRGDVKGNDGCKDLDGISTDELEVAFDNPPNKLSAFALEMFLVQKCFNENRKKSTAESIHGAFAKYWDTMYVLSLLFVWISSYSIN